MMITQELDNTEPIGEILLNIAATHPGTQALGPGKRAVIWVQGCPFNCSGCIAPDWIEMKPAAFMSPADLANWVAGIDGIRGLTISGGEPMLQAQGLNTMLDLLRSKREIDVICFTGFRLENLLKSPPVPEVPDFIRNLDVLIDGLYVESLNNNIGLRGSTNQKIHHFSNRLNDFDFENTPRSMELNFTEDHILLAGIPTQSFLQAYDQTLNQIEKRIKFPDLFIKPENDLSTESDIESSGPEV